MTGYQTFLLYTSLRLHFNSPKHNFFKYEEKLKYSLLSFEARNDKFVFEKLGKQLSTKSECMYYFIANLLKDNIYVRSMDEDTFFNYKKRIQGLTYFYKSDIIYITEFLNNNKLHFNDLFSIGKSHPLIFKLVLGNKIMIETFIILDEFLNFIPNFNKIYYPSDPIWKSWYLKSKKYKPFLKLDENLLNQYKQILMENITHG